jgi:hypothetical protein
VGAARGEEGPPQCPHDGVAEEKEEDDALPRHVYHLRGPAFQSGRFLLGRHADGGNAQVYECKLASWGGSWTHPM